MKRKVFQWHVEKSEYRPNPFVNILSKSELLSSIADTTPSKLQIEDNIGESIHIHYRQFRFEMSYEDFKYFSKKVEESLWRLNEWVL